MARRKYVEPKYHYVLFCNGEQVIGTFYGDIDQARRAEGEAILENDGLNVVAERCWTLEDLRSYARADLAPDYVLEDDFEWS